MAATRICACQIRADGDLWPKSNIAVPEDLIQHFPLAIAERHKDFMHSPPLSRSNDDYFFAHAERMPASTRIARSPINGYEDFL